MKLQLNLVQTFQAVPWLARGLALSIIYANNGTLPKYLSGLENSTGQLLFTSALGCRASEKFDTYFFPIQANGFCDAGQVPI